MGPVNGIWARAPYNFIPLPQKIVVVDEKIPAQDLYSENTGYIVCHLTTESPLYIRCEQTTDEFKFDSDKTFSELPEEKKESYSAFFGMRAHGMPIIPGSSLRGMIRAMVEIVSYSAIRWVTDDKLVYRMVGDTSSLGQSYRERMKPENIFAGYMHWKGNAWQIIPANLIQGKPFYRVPNSIVQELGCPKWKNRRNAYEIYAKCDPVDDSSPAVVTKVSLKPDRDLNSLVNG